MQEGPTPPGGPSCVSTSRSARSTGTARMSAYGDETADAPCQSWLGGANTGRLRPSLRTTSGDASPSWRAKSRRPRGQIPGCDRRQIQSWTNGLASGSAGGCNRCRSLGRMGESPRAGWEPATVQPFHAHPRRRRGVRSGAVALRPRNHGGRAGSTGRWRPARGLRATPSLRRSRRLRTGQADRQWSHRGPASRRTEEASRIAQGRATRDAIDD